MVYYREVIYTTCGETILLKYIESFSRVRIPEEQIIDKLSDDYCFNIRTVSGKEFKISTRYIMEQIHANETDITEVAESIYSKWIWTNRRQGT